MHLSSFVAVRSQCTSLLPGLSPRVVVSVQGKGSGVGSGLKERYTARFCYIHRLC